MRSSRGGTGDDNLGLLSCCTPQAMLKEQAGHPSRAPIVTQLCDALGLEPAFFGRHWHFSHIHDAMTSLATHGKALPPGMTPALLREVDRLATKEFSASK